jgi:luciferase family oxidoreductase group 1
MIPFSVLDLSPIVEGGSAAQALANTLDLARHAERLGYARYWLAEHHNMPAVASAATSVVIGHVAAGTRTIRVGAGGIMLPNHAPLLIAEQFGTLESLFPGRIDLGLGRAPGSDQITAMALRRAANVDTFPQDVVELLAFLREPAPGQKVRAIPGAGLDVPVWILGSSLFGAQLAAELGLPYAFASHFAPAQMMQAIEVYRSRFKPSEYLDRSRLMLGVNAVVADSHEDARRLFTSHQQVFLALRRGQLGPLPPPLDPDRFDAQLTPLERAELAQTLSTAIVGTPDSVRQQLGEFLARTSPDEIIITGQIFDHRARVRSYELLAEVRSALAGEHAASPTA